MAKEEHEIYDIAKIDIIGKKYIGNTKPWDDLKMPAIDFLQYLLYTTNNYQFDTETLKKAIEFESKDLTEEEQHTNIDFFYQVVNAGKKE